LEFGELSAGQISLEPLQAFARRANHAFEAAHGFVERLVGAFQSGPDLLEMLGELRNAGV
jgi:hypothetical protein